MCFPSVLVACLVAALAGVQGIPLANSQGPASIDLRMSQAYRLPGTEEVDWTKLFLSQLLEGASPCTCSEKECGCCQPVKISALGIDTQACANVTFLSTQIGATLSLSLDGKVLFKKTVSVKNPDPVCVKFSGKYGAEICGELYKLAVSTTEFEGCARLEGKVLGETVANVDLGCFKMPFKSEAHSPGIEAAYESTQDSGVDLMDASPCSCAEKTCGCCRPVKIPALGIDTQACANVTFLSSQIGATLSLSLDGKILFKKTVSVKNPDPVCVKFPGKYGAEICGELYKLAVSTTEFEGCARLEGKVLGETVANVDLGCFKMPFKSEAHSPGIEAEHESTQDSGVDLMDASPCSCAEKTCGCCQPVKIPALGIDTQACANVTFLSSQIGATLSLSLDGKILFKKTVSVKNPDPVCVKFPGKYGAEICGELYKLAVSTTEFEGCARLEGKVLGETVANVDLGCFKMPFKSEAHSPGIEAEHESTQDSGVDLMDASPCSCAEKTCGCCQPVKIPALGIDTQACANVTFLSSQIGATLSLSLDGKILFKKTVSVKNPDPVCVKFPGKYGAEICGELYKLAVSTTEFEGCARLEGKVLGKTVANVDLGCFKMPFKSEAQSPGIEAEHESTQDSGVDLMDASPCSCAEKTCGCCQPVKIPALGIDTQACANVTFLSSQIGATLSLSLDGKILFKKTVSVKNPDPVCVKFPGKYGAEICGELYKLAVSTTEFEGCARLEGKVLGKTVANVDLGCFKMPFKSEAQSPGIEAEHESTQDYGVDLMDASPCSCAEKTCGCCQPVKIPALGIDTQACANVTFLSSQIGATLSLSLDGKILFKKTVSVKNPDPVCVKFPGKYGAEICGELYKLAVSTTEFEGCARLEGKVLGKTVANVDLGCFKMPFKSEAQSPGIEAEHESTQDSGVDLMDASPCSCAEKTCGCCQPVKIPALGIDTQACANVTFLSSQIGATLSLSLDGKILFKKTVSVKNPDPVCVKFPGKYGAEICGELYKLAVSTTEFEGCARLEGKVLGKTVANVDLGCFKMPFKSEAQSPGIEAEHESTQDSGVDLMDASPCSCAEKTCGCCQPVKIPALGIDTQACANVTFLSSQIGATLSLSLDGKILFKKTVSVKNPDPVCVKFPGKYGAEICGELYKLAVSTTEFEGCARLEGKVLGETVANVDLGCFKMPFKATHPGFLSVENNGVAEQTNLATRPGANEACSCSKDQCACCQHVSIKQLKIDSNVCIQIQFLSSSIGVSLTLTIDGKVVFKKTLSLKSPPPVCVPVPGGKICVVLYDMAVTLHDISGCGRLEAKYLWHTVARVNLGCFKIPLRLAAYGQSAEGLLYLGDAARVFAGPGAAGAVDSPLGDLSPDALPLIIQLEPYQSDEVN